MGGKTSKETGRKQSPLLKCKACHSTPSDTEPFRLCIYLHVNKI